MKKTYKRLIIGGLAIGAYFLWRKANEENQPYRVASTVQAKAPIEIKPRRLWLVSMKDGSTEELTSAELQRKVNTGSVASYVEKDQF